MWTRSGLVRPLTLTALLTATVLALMLVSGPKLTWTRAGGGLVFECGYVYAWVCPGGEILACVAVGPGKTRRPYLLESPWWEPPVNRCPAPPPVVVRIGRSTSSVEYHVVADERK